MAKAFLVLTSSIFSLPFLLIEEATKSSGLEQTPGRCYRLEIQGGVLGNSVNKGTLLRLQEEATFPCLSCGRTKRLSCPAFLSGGCP